MIFSREIKKINWWVQAITKLWECLIYIVFVREQINIHNCLIWQWYFHTCNIAETLFKFFHRSYKCIGLKLSSTNFHQHLLVTLKSSIKQNNMG